MILKLWLGRNFHRRQREYLRYQPGSSVSMFQVCLGSSTCVEIAFQSLVCRSVDKRHNPNYPVCTNSRTNVHFGSPLNTTDHSPLNKPVFHFIHPLISSHFIGQLGDGETRNIECSEIHSGRFLAVYLDHNGILTLCEVQVFGCK